MAAPPLCGTLMRIMWNDEKSRRFDHLRREQAHRALTEAEQADLASLVAELDAEEVQALKPALDRLTREADELRARKAQVEAHARELERIVEQQERLLAEAHAYAERLRKTRNALADEFQRVRTSAAQAAR